MSPFAEELLNIKLAALPPFSSRVIGGAALGALGSTLMPSVSLGQGALVGGLAGSGIREGGYSWKTPLALGAIGATGYYGKKAIDNQMRRDLAVNDAYNRGIQNAPASNPGRWM